MAESKRTETVAAHPSGWRARLARWLPDTLFGRLVLVLAVGMLATQFLTSSIWLDLRHTQTLETPTRVAAERLADAIQVLAHNHQDPQALAYLTGPGLQTRVVDQAQAPYPAEDPALQQEAQALVNRVLHVRLPQVADVQLLRLRLVDAQGHALPRSSYFGLNPFTVDYGLQIELTAGRWLVLDTQLSPGWHAQSGWEVLADVLLRVYLLRILVVVLLVLLAVRWVVTPLLRMAQAAQALERDVVAAPRMPESGPREVRQAAHAINRMQQRIAANLQERTQFLAAVSHDLRTPITRMRLRLELLDSAELERSKRKLRGDLSCMEGLIDSTLALILAREHQGPLQQIDLDALARSICQDRQEVGQAVDIQGHIHEPVMGQPVSLRRALDNLIDNALRYAGSACVVLAEDATDAYLCVEDKGPGIPAAHLERMRQPFERGDASRNQDTGGHGLGLSIVDAIAQAHGGALLLRNRQPQGLSACLRIRKNRHSPL
ncbi:signal transduction histidine kinase [Comamonas sp. BIGb0152]|uniref:ATP-binding protein n=1 Tax=Comamonas sp. BIGb0152 TaxID=2940601 RepID=UPI00216767B9|nr:ATP-binding protein [Comamonas sp. BIGb0152]MCS4293791.1 signal transduction histidine kinase [Comamonas sp. BIGb0152]